MPPKKVPSRPKHPSGPPSASNTKKRKEPPAEPNSNGRSSKSRFPPRFVPGGRDIPSQSPGAALAPDGELDLQAFLAAREFEIRALQESMAVSRSSGTKRAFQLVPRGLRRRTASHNAKRVPRRLRNRSEREMRDDNTPTVTARRREPRTSRAWLRLETAKKLRKLANGKRAAGKVEEFIQSRKKAGGQDETAGGSDAREARAATVVSRPARPKIRRNMLNDPPKPDSKFRKRQANKTWMPTHVWHAKRARMTPPGAPLWRFAVPLTPSEKVYRPTHRAQGQRGVVVWDVSYVSTIALAGNAAGVTRVLRRMGVEGGGCWGEERGRRWRDGERFWTGMLTRERKRETREICPAEILWNPEDAGDVESIPPRTRLRRVMIRVHPSAFLEVFHELLRWVKMEKPKVYVEDLRFEVGSIELTGPASTEALLAVLHPFHTGAAAKEHHASVFAALSGLTNPASVPANALLAFSVRDPRLGSPPRRAAAPGEDDEDAQIRLCEALAAWPADESRRPFSLFDRNARHRASQLPSQGSINRRKGASVPGKPVSLKSPADPPIPVILLASRPPPSAPRAQGSWTLLAPWKTILPFWYGLMHVPLSSGGLPRFGGLNEMRQVAFERGMRCFPFDFPATDAGAAWEEEMRIRREREWESRPKGKRIRWESVRLGCGRKGEVGTPWGCAWEQVFGSGGDGGGGDEDEMEVDDDGVGRGTGRPFKPFSLRSMTNVSRRAFHELLGSRDPAVPRHAIVTVRIGFPSRGATGPRARIYRLPAPTPTFPPATDAEVSASESPLLEASPVRVRGRLPADLRNRWLAQLPATHPAHPRSQPAGGPRKNLWRAPYFPPNTDLFTRKGILVRALFSTPPLPKSAESGEYACPPVEGKGGSDDDEMYGTHPVVPDAGDLIGFVLEGSFCLASGRGSAVACLAVEKVLEGWRGGKDEGSLCIVRNLGESVGRIATWTAI